jgi:YHS domain-containing protein
MIFIARILRFLFWLLVLSWGVRILRHFFGKMLGNAAATSDQNMDATAAEQTPATSRRLVRDPVCGMHVDEALSIPLRTEGELVHFCSTACRDKYAVSAQKRAANG